MSYADLRAELPADPEGLVADEGLLTFGDYLDVVTAVEDELRFRVLYATLVTEAPTVDALAGAVGADADAVEAALADLIEAGAVAEKMACLVDGEAAVYETTAIARTYLTEGPIAALGHED